MTKKAGKIENLFPLLTFMTTDDLWNLMYEKEYEPCIILHLRLTASLYKPAEDSIFKDDSIEEWINLSSTKFLMESGFTGPGATGDASFNFSNVSHMSKKSLLNKLETISKGELNVQFN